MDAKTAPYLFGGAKPSTIFSPAAAGQLIDLYATNPAAAQAQFNARTTAAGWSPAFQSRVWNGMLAELKKRQ